MEQAINVESLLEKYSTEQVLKAIHNFYKCLVDLDQCEELFGKKSSGPRQTSHVQRTQATMTSTSKDYDEPVETSDHQPCHDCGGTIFLRTGTCHVCQTCGASQGCS